MIDATSNAGGVAGVWPKAPNALSGTLKRLAPNLRAAGVNVTRPNRAGKKGARLLQLERINISSSEPSEPSEGLDTSADSLIPSDSLADDLAASDDLAGETCRSSTVEDSWESVPSDDGSDDSDGLL